MDDLISRQAVLQICREKIWNGADDYEPISSRGIAERVKTMPSVQPNLQPACNNLATDTISRQAALDAMKEAFNPSITNFVKAKMAIDNLPSAQSEKRTEERTETHECDLISRQDFDKFLEDAEKKAAKYRKYVFASALNTIRGNLRNFPSAQPKSKERTAESSQNVPKEDLISRKAAIDAICDNCDAVEASCPHYPCGRYVAVEKLPSAQPEPQWIPVSKKSHPDTPKRVQVQLDNGWIITAYYEENEWLSVPYCDEPIEDRWIEAWKSLPEPYGGDKNDKSGSN